MYFTVKPKIQAKKSTKVSNEDLVAGFYQFCP